MNPDTAIITALKYVRKGDLIAQPKAPPPSSAWEVMTNGHLTELLDLLAGPVQWG